MPSSISFKSKPSIATASTPTPAPVAATPAPTPTPTVITPQVVAPEAPKAPKVTKPKAAPAPEVIEAVTTVTSEAVAIAASQELTPADYYGGLGQFEGEFSASEMRTPYLGICGPSSQSFASNPELLGQWVLNKTTGLGDTIKAVFFRAKKRWVEDLPYDPDSKVIPKTFDFIADARAAGFNESQLKDVADLDMLIEVPLEIEGVAEVADLIVGDFAYLLARYSVQSSSYGATIPTLMSDLRGFLKGNLMNGYYELSTVRIAKKNVYYVPKIKTDGPTSAELKAAIVARCAPVGV